MFLRLSGHLLCLFWGFSLFFGPLTPVIALPIVDDRGNAGWVQFDVPALLAAREAPCDLSDVDPKLRTIVVVVPVSSEIRADFAVRPSAFRFDVYWNRNAFPLVDYSPRTQTVSDIAGTISIDRFSEKNSNLNLNFNGAFPTVGNGGAKAEFVGRQGEKVRYDEIPQHEILVASGTLKRGTGAYFRFHPSRAETLEGGRELKLMFQVPLSWRGGVLQVECQAAGSRKSLAWTEPVEIRRSFVVPIYLESDEEALQTAMDFAQREQRLRQSWQNYLQQSSHSQPLGPFEAMFPQSRSKGKPKIPEDWVHVLIQVSDNPLERYRSALPEELAAAASDFVESRANLLKISR
jgi:hypothetical protein